MAMAGSDFAFFEPADNSIHIRLNKATGFIDGGGWGSNVFGNKKEESSLLETSTGTEKATLLLLSRGRSGLRRITQGSIRD